jgi:hypothetical protein
MAVLLARMLSVALQNKPPEQLICTLTPVWYCAGAAGVVN